MSRRSFFFLISLSALLALGFTSARANRHHHSVSICDNARKTWDDEHRRIENGSAPAMVPLSNVNGPVSVRESSEKLSGQRLCAEGRRARIKLYGMDALRLLRIRFGACCWKPA